MVAAGVLFAPRQLPMSVLVRLLVLVEALVCFGPLLLLLALGLLYTRLDRLWPLVLAVLGLSGTLGLIFAITQIVSGRRWLLLPTRCLFAGGVFAVLLLNWTWIPSLLNGERALNDVWLVLFFLLLPVAGSLHLLWILSPETDRTLSWSRRSSPAP